VAVEAGDAIDVAGAEASIEMNISDNLKYTTSLADRLFPPGSRPADAL
jgi:hypothetical protein